MVGKDTAAGEGLVPGGVKALERLGLGDCAKTDIASIPVSPALVTASDEYALHFQLLQMSITIRHKPLTSTISNPSQSESAAGC